jgi:protein-S-isoprenylcysteine O-methyltransferase Ste14
MPFSIPDLLEGAWLIFLAVWFLMSLGVKPTVRQQNPFDRLFQIAIGAAAYLLLFSHVVRWEPLTRRVVPEAVAWRLAGLVMTCIGIAFAIWARIVIGANWSANVTIKRDHELVQTGPYAFVRHPIYSGLLFAGLGTALVVGQVRGFLAVAVAFIGWTFKSRREEQFMTEQFGDRYSQYRRRTGGIIPFIG